MHFERRNAFSKCIKSYFFPRKKMCVPTLPKIFRPVNTLIFLFGLISLICFGICIPEQDIIVHVGKMISRCVGQPHKSRIKINILPPNACSATEIV